MKTQVLCCEGQWCVFVRCNGFWRLLSRHSSINEAADQLDRIDELDGVHLKRFEQWLSKQPKMLTVTPKRLGQQTRSTILHLYQEWTNAHHRN